MKKLWLKVSISVAVGVVFVWLAVRGVDWPRVKQVLFQVDSSSLAAYLVILLVIHLVRIFRWGILLKPLGQVSFAKLLSAGSVGILAQMLLPLRLGEFVRPVLIAEKGKIRISAALATVVTERLIDGLSMTCLFVILVFVIQGEMAASLQMRSWGFVVLSVFAVLLVFLILAYRNRDRAVAWLGRLLRFLPDRLSDKILLMLKSFIDGLQALPRYRLLSSFLLLTAIYWGLSGGGMLFMLKTFPQLRHLGWLEAFTCLSVLCVGLMIPAGPGMIGNFHYFVKVGLSLFVSQQVLDSAGLAYAIIIHAMQLGQQLVVGLVFLFFGPTSLRQILGAPSRTEISLGQNSATQSE